MSALYAFVWVGACATVFAGVLCVCVLCVVVFVFFALVYGYVCGGEGRLEDSNEKHQEKINIIFFQKKLWGINPTSHARRLNKLTN